VDGHREIQCGGLKPSIQLSKSWAFCWRLLTADSSSYAALANAQRANPLQPGIHFSATSIETRRGPRVTSSDSTREEFRG
jgi:hypothetical protein